MRIWIIAPLGLALLTAACGDTRQYRAATGATTGVIAGALVGGPWGALAGAAIGGAGGAYRDEIEQEVGQAAGLIEEKQPGELAARDGQPGQQAGASQPDQQAAVTPDETGSRRQPDPSAAAMNGLKPTNEEVREAQKALSEIGLYEAKIDGLYGPRTIRAVGEFQALANLPRTRTLDDRTMQQLRDELAAAGDNGNQQQSRREQQPPPPEQQPPAREQQPPPPEQQPPSGDSRPQ